MNGFQAIILGVLQGITEFLPISSSGHLVLAETYLHLDVASLEGFDIIVHVGTLLAIILYFWKDVYGMIKAFLRFFVGDFSGEYSKMILYIVVGTIPAVIVGFTLGDTIEQYFRNTTLVAVFMILIGLVFFWSEAVHSRLKRSGITFSKAIVIGLIQSIALIPGVSRSGSTISAGLFQGMSRSSAARFSFLLGIPAIAGAGVLEGIDIAKTGSLGVPALPALLGFISSFVAGVFSVWFLMKFLKNHSLRVFGAYLLVIGTGVIIVSLFQ